MSLPLFRDFNVLSFQVVVLSLESLSLNIFYDSFVVLFKCVEDIECICAVWLTTFWQEVWKEFHQVRILLHNYAHSVPDPDPHQIKKMQTKNIVFFLLFNQQQFSVQTKGRILLQFLNSDPDPARLIRIGNTEQNCAGLIIKLQACGLPAPPCLGERIEFSIISTHHIRLQEVACATMNKR